MMMNERMGIGSPVERELQYYRRECNDLGSRLLRMQEEQSQAFLEARRSRTVVRLVREAYRLAEPVQAADDIGGPLLQVVVENALCDRAALLREEPLGSGRFLVAHAIGGTNVEVNEEILIPEPPGFFFSSSLRLDRPPAGLMDVLRLPYVLWAYDQSSGHALAIGNRSEANVSRPFESGDQELIETALSVYLDVLYRKHAETQLRQAKQAAEEASQARARFLEDLAQQLRLPVERLVSLSESLASHPEIDRQPAEIREASQRIVESSRELAALADDALRIATPHETSLLLDVAWIDLSEMIRRVHRSLYPTSLKIGVELNVGLPRRSVSVCADRDSLHRALQTIVGGAMSRAFPGSAVKMFAERRGDGAVEVLVSSRGDNHVSDEGMAPDQPGAVQTAPGQLAAQAEKLVSARRVVEAHGGVLITEPRSMGGRQVRIILPPKMARDDSLSP